MIEGDELGDHATHRPTDQVCRVDREHVAQLDHVGHEIVEQVGRRRGDDRRAAAVAVVEPDHPVARLEKWIDDDGRPPEPGAVGAGEQRPVVKDGQLAVATVMTVTLSADHRVVDGAVGAEWLQAFKGYVESPVTMLL